MIHLVFDLAVTMFALSTSCLTDCSRFLHVQVAQDFDDDYDREVGGSATLEADLFGDLVGCDAVAKVLMRCRATLRTMQERGMPTSNDLMSLNFRFTGAPGKL